MSEIGEFLRIWGGDGNSSDVSIEDEPRIDAAVSRYIDTGKGIDTLLCLSHVSGSEIKVLASHIVCWLPSTPESRSKSWIRERDFDEEEKSVVGEEWKDA